MKCCCSFVRWLDAPTETEQGLQRRWRPEARTVHGAAIAAAKREVACFHALVCKVQGATRLAVAIEATLVAKREGGASRIRVAVVVKSTGGSRRRSTLGGS